MEYLLKIEEVEKLKVKLKQLDEESTSISSEINESIREDREFLSSDRYRILKKRIKVDIPNEISKIEERLKHVKIISNNDFTFDGSTVSLYTKVTLDYEGEIETFSIVPIYEIDLENNQVSYNSPIARAIMGKKKGEKIRFGDILVTILNVEKI